MINPPLDTGVLFKNRFIVTRKISKIGNAKISVGTNNVARTFGRLPATFRERIDNAKT